MRGPERVLSGPISPLGVDGDAGTRSRTGRPQGAPPYHNTYRKRPPGPPGQMSEFSVPEAGFGTRSAS